MGRFRTSTFVPDAFQQIVAAQPSLLVVDLCYGEPASWTLLTALRQAATTQQIPLFLVSTSAQYLRRAKANHALWRGNRYLLKPIDLTALLQAIQELIGPA